MTIAERDKEFRSAVRAKYGYKCSACGLPQKLQQARNGRSLCVHRIRPGADYTIDGCVPLRQSCHSRAHGKARRGSRPSDPIVMPAREVVFPCKVSAEAFGILRQRAAELDMPEQTLAALLLEQAIRGGAPC